MSQLPIRHRLSTTFVQCGVLFAVCLIAFAPSALIAQDELQISVSGEQLKQITVQTQDGESVLWFIAHPWDLETMEIGNRLIFPACSVSQSSGQAVVRGKVIAQKIVDGAIKSRAKTFQIKLSDVDGPEQPGDSPPGGDNPSPPPSPPGFSDEQAKAVYEFAFAGAQKINQPIVANLLAKAYINAASQIRDGDDLLSAMKIAQSARASAFRTVSRKTGWNQFVNEMSANLLSHEFKKTSNYKRWLIAIARGIDCSDGSCDLK